MRELGFPPLPPFPSCYRGAPQPLSRRLTNEHFAKIWRLTMAENNPKPSENIKTETPSDTVWTIMVYLAGDNNLADECVFALTQIKEVDTDKRVRVVAQFDPTGRRLKTRRFTI